MSKFRVMPTGFQITLPNNYTVSVQFGVVHYCDNRKLLFDGEIDEKMAEPCKDAEIAVLDPEGKFVTLEEENDDVLGWQSSADFLAILNRVGGVR